MVKLGNVSRRWVLSLLAGVLAMPTATRPAGRSADAETETIVLVDGWILRAGDLEKAAAHAA